MKKLFDKILKLNREVWTIILAFVVVFILTTVLVLITRNKNNEDEKFKAVDLTKEQYIESTTVKKEALSDHATSSNCWIIYKTGVYDISDIITKQKAIVKSQCGTEIESELDTKTLSLITPYLIAYTYDSQITQK